MASEVKKAVLRHSRKVSMAHVEADADPLENLPVMDPCQTQLLPTAVITTIIGDTNVRLFLICIEKLQIFDEGQQFSSSLFFTEAAAFYWSHLLSLT